MVKIVIRIDGMKCGMCESHINDLVRRTANVKSVKSSHAKNRTEIVADDGFDCTAVTQAIEAEGYGVLGVSEESYEKKGLFSFFKK